MEKENKLIKNKHLFVFLDEQKLKIQSQYYDELDYIKKYFCGRIVTNLEYFDKHILEPNTIVYICGNIKQNLNHMIVDKNAVINIIKELSCDYDDYLNMSSFPIPDEEYTKLDEVISLSISSYVLCTPECLFCLQEKIQLLHYCASFGLGDALMKDGILYIEVDAESG